MIRDKRLRTLIKLATNARVTDTWEETNVKKVDGLINMLECCEPAEYTHFLMSVLRTMLMHLVHRAEDGKEAYVPPAWDPSPEETKEFLELRVKGWICPSEDLIVRTRELMLKVGPAASYYFLLYIQERYGLGVSLQILDAKTLALLKDRPNE